MIIKVSTIRRDILGIAIIVITILTAIDSSAGKTISEKPNLLIIQTDEHNFRTLGCYRKTLSDEQAYMWGKDAVVHTPNIDRLAQQGAIATKFYASTPVCSPSRASFISGLYPQNTSVIANDIPMDDEVTSFAEILQQNGYTTGYAGKWHLDGDGKPQWEPKRKFGFEDNRYMFNRGHWKQIEDSAQGPRVKSRKNGKPTTSVEGADSESFTTDWLIDKAIEFISINRNKPFCYMVSIPDPHGPDTVREPYNSMYDNMTFEKPRTYDRPTQDAPSWAKPMVCGYNQSKYYGMVKCIDDNVGKIMKYLNQIKLIDNTIVVFTSDHGDLRCEHHRHNKAVPLEASVKIPFIIYYPDKIKAGTTVTKALGTVDFLPTILGIMGIVSEHSFQGRNASNLFKGGEAPNGWKDITFVRGPGEPDQSWLAAFTGRYKLIVSSHDPPWLIDMKIDPDEVRNFCFNPEYREVVCTLAIELIEYGKKYNDTRISVKSIAEDLAKLAKRPI